MCPLGETQHGSRGGESPGSANPELPGWAGPPQPGGRGRGAAEAPWRQRSPAAGRRPLWKAFLPYHRAGMHRGLARTATSWPRTGLLSVRPTQPCQQHSAMGARLPKCHCPGEGHPPRTPPAQNPKDTPRSSLPHGVTRGALWSFMRNIPEGCQYMGFISCQESTFGSLKIASASFSYLSAKIIPLCLIIYSNNKSQQGNLHRTIYYYDQCFSFLRSLQTEKNTYSFRKAHSLKNMWSIWFC